MYVGMSASVKSRISHHRGQQPWGYVMDAYKARAYPDEKTALAVEDRAIKILRPIHNLRGARQPRDYVHKDFAAFDDRIGMAKTCKHDWALTVGIHREKCLVCGMYETVVRGLNDAEDV